MSSEQIWLAAGGALTALLLVVVLALAVAVRRYGRRQGVLADRVDALEAELVASRDRGSHLVQPPASYVITGVGEGEVDGDRDEAGHDGADVPVQGHIDRAVFADIVAREGVIKAAGLAHGLRRALSPATRNRIRFEVGREVKRSRKQRRTDLKTALRDMQARERARMAEARDEGDAA
ncbi:hypothetical protein [Nocardioides sp. P5_C9_2]